MLHILLLVFKIIGIVLLVILGILLLLLLTVLLVPVRYRGEASFHGSLRGKGRVTWLLHLLSLQVSYEGVPDITIRIFGKRILTGTSEKDTDKEEDRENSKEGEERWETKEAEGDEAADGDEMILSAQEMTFEEVEADPPPAEETFSTQKSVRSSSKSKVRYRIGRWKQKLASMPQEVKRRFQAGRKKLEKGEESYRQAMEFLSQEENQRTLKLLKRQLCKLFRHLAPRRLQGELTFGLEDPYRMGQIVSAAAFLYPILQDRICFTPVFGEKIFDGEVSLRGRIRVGTLLWLAVRVFLDKNFRKLLKKILNRGGHKNGR